MDKDIIICISGGFDPLHGGHIDMFKEAKEKVILHYKTLPNVLGEEYVKFRTLVLLNSDEWLIKKKGKLFMCWEERAKIVSSLKWVSGVTNVFDKDGTVCAGLQQVHPHYFVNGGDRTEESTPELSLCKELGIVPIFNVGGIKTQSSSDLLREYVNKA